ncbi:NAPDH-dependent diflavin reductase [Vermiconidia calcicola]|uniref:NAPDH-dependent diflavin reductase n=1 Tax=Vermiconidia calcicola TaxID=1690605 RepID=A0ACC3NJM1_9PEZI|nr:NAPDH-dependent diflavin reductase [Vermiconidia calcicola]
MERAGHDNALLAHSGKNTHVPQKQGKSRTALILYGSETGNAQDVAEEVGRMAERLRFDTTVLDMDSAQLKDIVKPTAVIFALSTTGQGEMPQNARLFWKTLLSGALKSGILRRVRFSSFGLGDSSYARYNVAHRMLCGRMQQLGARLFSERGEGNEQHPEGHSAGFREWIVSLKQGLLDSFPLFGRVEPIADDQFLEPKWKLDLSEHVAMSNGYSHALDSTNGDSAAVGVTGHLTNGHAVEKGEEDGEAQTVPSPALMPVKGAHIAKVVAHERVTAPGHFQDVRLADLRLEDQILYGPGAIAVIYPKNFPGDIQEFIDLMEWQSVADRPLALRPNANHDLGQDHSPSPLRHLALTNVTLTLRWLLENVLDIMSVPRRSFFASLSHFANRDNEDSAYQKERLLELANPELIDELWDYTTRPKRTILEVMMDFTTIKIPWQYCLSVLPMMKGRQFSIASGGHLKTDDVGRTRVQLLVAIAEPPSPIIKYRRRYGVCTRYMASLRAGQELAIGIQEGYLDVRPSELVVPIVMIGPGTGLAPMRAMIWQRLLWSQATQVKAGGKGRLDGDILIFGCRNEDGDYFFRDEWETFLSQHGLTVLTAFSRDKDKPRQYVQDQIRQNATRIRQALLEQKGKVYVCGSSGNMPKGVREALIDILAMEQGQQGNMGREEAEEYLDRMEKQGRYKQETW